MKFQDAMNRITGRQLRTVDTLYGSEDNLEGSAPSPRSAIRSGRAGSAVPAGSQISVCMR
jgi:hypothetical protein